VFKRTDLLIITPATTGGSWAFLDGFLRRLGPSVSMSICSSQELQKKPWDARMFSIPLPRYDKYGLLINSRMIFAIVYNIPLLVLANLVLLIEKPRLVIANGIASGIGLLPLSSLIRSKMIISYRGYLGEQLKGFVRRLIAGFQRFFSLVIVNSETSKRDLERIIPMNKLMIVRHSADESFFLHRDRQKLRSELGLDQKFTILFIGRIDREKQAPLLLEVAKSPSLRKGFMFLFAGIGESAKDVREASKVFPNIRYLGYIVKREEIAELLTSADVVWAYADETYLARPAVESLACGTPILVPETPAVLRRAHEGVRVPEELVRGVGWIIKERRPDDVAKKILNLKGGGLLNDQLRTYCREYALKKHSRRNLDAVVDLAAQMLAQL
jgi:glycosyltransferase involved in cell wall biosynthesis